MTMSTTRFVSSLLLSALTSSLWATPAFVEHLTGNQVFGEPAGITMREPEIPREDEAVEIWARIGYSFFYTDVAIYYTTDGSTPSGLRGVPNGTTQVLRSSAGQVNFVRNQSSGGGQIDWWKATMPANTRTYGNNLRYRIGAWHSSGGPEILANNYGCDDGVCDNPAGTPMTYSYSNRIAWPGAGAGQPSPNAGYPPVNFWKEEAVVGNTYTNVMLDQNGTLYDMYYPSAGAVQGVSTRNEGYVGGNDTFPPGLPLGNRGQMNFNQLMAGLRVDGTTHWLSNPNGVSYNNITQSYVGDTNVVQSSARLTAGGNNILVQQFDFSPYGITFPNDQGGNPNRGLYVKRYILTNQGSTAKTVNFYVYGDWAINGGENHDVAFTDASRGAMIAYDNVDRFTSSNGEYNPSTFGDYRKDKSVYLATSMKVLNTVGGQQGDFATDFWKETSTDNGQGWIASRIVLQPGVAKEVNIMVAGGFDNFPNASGTYNYQVAPALDWFRDTSMASVQNGTEQAWVDWVNNGVTVDFPDDRYDKLFKRGKLGTALHLDGKNGGVVAGMHNGAYPYVWPRDAMYAAVSLARAGHFEEARAAIKWMRDVAFRGNESWGKGFWYQKYTTDGYIIWSAPQVDETAVLPWAVWYLYQANNNFTDISANYNMVVDSAFAMSSDSGLDGRLYFDDTYNLMHSMNVWEDSFALHLYSNANVWRGLKDAASIALASGQPNGGTNAATFNSRAASIMNGLRARLAWNGENTDISQLGLVYPFNVISPNDPDAVRLINRMNGTAGDAWGNIHPLLRTSGEWNGLIDRYWGDTYWNGGPWFLSTLWYGLYYMEKADLTPGSGDVNVHKNKIDLLIDKLGPAGFGAEQIAPSSSLLYPGQPDFTLQAAWPNAWESMSTFMDGIMAFLDWEPSAPSNTLKFAPKFPTGWNSMLFNGLRSGQTARYDVRMDQTTRWIQCTVTNTNGGAQNIDIYFKLPPGQREIRVTKNGAPISFAYDSATHRVRVQNSIFTGTGSSTAIRVEMTAPRQPAGDRTRS